MYHDYGVDLRCPLNLAVIVAGDMHVIDVDRLQNLTVSWCNG